MKKSKKNYKKIIVIALAISLALAGAIYGVNTKQLTGFTGIGQEDFKPRFNPQQLEVDLTQLRYEAHRDPVNNSVRNEYCNTGVWKKTGRYLINTNQTEESVDLFGNNLQWPLYAGCDLRIQMHTTARTHDNDKNQPHPSKGSNHQRFECDNFQVDLGDSLKCEMVRNGRHENIIFSIERNGDESQIKAAFEKINYPSYEFEIYGADSLEIQGNQVVEFFTR